jgi:hypothetical protein
MPGTQKYRNMARTERVYIDIKYYATYTQI